MLISCNRGAGNTGASSSVPTVIATDKTVKRTESVILETRVVYTNEKTRAGIFVGIPRDWAAFRYVGYAVLVEGKTVTLYSAGVEMRALAWASLTLTEKAYGLRVTLEKNLCCVYVDDGSGWKDMPEIMHMLEETNGYTVGTVELSGYACSMEKLTVKQNEEVIGVDQIYQNPVLDDHADPDVLLYKGTYYLYATESSPGYRVYTSNDLVDWTLAGTAVEPNLWGVSTNYWAPDVEYINGKFYMVVSCNGNLGLAVSDSPLGPFREAHDRLLFDCTIDGHLFVDDDGSVYLYYVSWRSGHTYGIYGTKLDGNMMPIPETEKLLLVPKDWWEKQQSGVVEGPYILKRNGLYYLTYSGSHYESKNYAVGYAISESPLGDYERYKGNPILIGNDKISGTGHHCVTTSLDGSEMWIVYHQHATTMSIHPRKLCIDRLYFRETDKGPDILEVIGPTTTPQMRQ
jgi:GH43 family beta-xylosidase